MDQPILEDVRLVGERVVLRPLRPQDAPLAFEHVYRRRSILQWLLWQGPSAPAEMDEWCERWATPSSDGWNYHFAICELADESRFLGSIGPRFEGHPYVGDVGYWLAESAWGRGYMSEAVFLCCHLCFRHLAARALTAEVFDGNAASERVLVKNAFRREPGAHECRLADGQTRRAWQFSLTRRAFERAMEGREPLEEHVVLRASVADGKQGTG